jgi:hypothetical protein
MDRRHEFNAQANYCTSLQNKIQQVGSDKDIKVNVLAFWPRLINLKKGNGKQLQKICTIDTVIYWMCLL